ncbi:unnamed protein product [Hermetia illucens]|uniref:SHSP domain-containing protein n=1 Tax=Hermetia illucens TaxID=343691 RepID=A0A7R8YRH6_HERIL|nr:heat shock protein 27-like [Hermetia illucens]CAD7082728.1 unnamed protein product [Hermetia illucens]
MSAIPFLLNLADELNDLESWRIPDDFGMAIYPADLRRSQRVPARLPVSLPRGRNYPYALAKKPQDKVKAKVENAVGKNGFQVCMDVQQFKPNELTVKTVDNTIVVEGKHEERQDSHGFISRHFVRKYTLPEDYDPNDVVSTLSSDGVLTVKAPPPSKSDAAERVVQIQHTGPAHLSVKDNSEPTTSKPVAVQDGVENGEKSNEKMED